MKSSFEQRGGTYRQVGDYRIPNLILPPDEAAIRLGKWGMLHKNYMIQHKKVQFTIMLSQETLWMYLSEVDKQASTMFSRLVEQMKVNEGITEQLKADNQMEWIQRMNNIESRARETVYNELIYI